MRLRYSLAMAAICAVLPLALNACHQASTKTDADAPMFIDDHGRLTVPASSPLRSHLVVQPVDSSAGEAQIDLPAAVEADPARVANILSPLTGRVLALKVELGQHVKRGQVLVVIASGDFAQAQDDDEKARDALALAKKGLDRARGVQEAGGASGKDLEAAQSAYNQAQAEQTRSQARLVSLAGAAGERSRQLVVTAPQSGVVTTLAVASGVQVNDPTAALMTVTNLDRVFVTAYVAENDIGKVSLGSQAQIVLTAAPQRPLQGKIAEVNASVEPDTRRQKVRIALMNGDGRLLPNMYATVRLPAPPSGGVYVPQSSLMMNNDALSVLVEVQPWVFQRRTVQIGDETDAVAHVLSGLKAGERVVVRGGVLLDD